VSRQAVGGWACQSEVRDGVRRAGCPLWSRAAAPVVCSRQREWKHRVGGLEFWLRVRCSGSRYRTRGGGVEDSVSGGPR
jgi:hypothetical protein